MYFIGFGRKSTYSYDRVKVRTLGQDDRLGAVLVRTKP